MKIAGIVAEYNPFHKGHAYQIKKIRELLGADTGVVCVMSGDFVQRGEPAMFSKYARAEAAVRCGADLVLELPVHSSVSGAERFARGAVEILGKLGIVDYLVFGSECGGTEVLCKTADALLQPEFDDVIKLKLSTGCSYPTARSQALEQLMDGMDVTKVPNDNLGVEYIKALKRFGFDIEPIAIKREGAMHDEAYDGEMKSGSEIRRIVAEGLDYESYVPAAAAAIYEAEIRMGRGPVTTDDLEDAILSRLRVLPAQAFEKLPDAAEGLENRLLRACRSCCSLSEIYDTVKTKRYTHARIRRMVMCAALGITGQDYDVPTTFARVLALNSRGAALIKQAQASEGISVISKPAVIRELDADSLHLFETTASAHDLYVLGYRERKERAGEQDWRKSPIYISDSVYGEK